MKINEILDIFNPAKQAEKDRLRDQAAQQLNVIATAEREWKNQIKANKVDPNNTAIMSQLLAKFMVDYFTSGEDQFTRQQVINAIKTNLPKTFDINSLRPFFGAVNKARLDAQQGKSTVGPDQQISPPVQSQPVQSKAVPTTVPQKKDHMSVVYIPTEAGIRTFWYDFGLGKWKEFTGTNFPADLSTSQVVVNPKEIDSISARVAKRKTKFVPYGSKSKRTRRRK
jgi:hypothetical protein